MSIRTGAQQPHINKGEVDASLLVVPPEKILQDYYKITDPIYASIVSKAFENQQLIQLRDWLLPMLMNGQVKISTK
jgi:type I restriction enzyme S subunit